MCAQLCVEVLDFQHELLECSSFFSCFILVFVKLGFGVTSRVSFNILQFCLAYFPNLYQGVAHHVCSPHKRCLYSFNAYL